MPLANWATISQQLAIKFESDLNYGFVIAARRDGWSRPLGAGRSRPMRFIEKNNA